MQDAVSWNIFRLVGDGMHLAGMVLGLLAVLATGTVECFSRKTQVLYQLVYVSRYLDVFVDSQVMYLLCFKIAFNLITATMLLLFARLHHTYDAGADSCNLLALVAPALVLAHAASTGSGFCEEMWTLSELLEPVALVPQYILCYRAAKVRPVVVLYVLAVGGYRLLYVCNWIYKRTQWHSAYRDYTSWFGGAIECVLFIDFIVRISRRSEVVGELGVTALGRMVLAVDDRAGRLSEKVEMATMGRRIPFGLSGHGQDERKRKEWDYSDRHSDGESCGLLSGSVDTEI